jgi:CubicO group peptidase (beta-lactamase class C family)
MDEPLSDWESDVQEPAPARVTPMEQASAPIKRGDNEREELSLGGSIASENAALVAAPFLPSRADMERAAEYSRTHEGDALIVMTADGRLLFEDYAPGAGPDRPHRLASGTKTFWGLLAVAAAQDGLLVLDERAAETITEWRSHPLKSRITVRQLLNFTSGLDPATQEMRARPRSEDKFARALQVAAIAEPGSTFAYGPSHLAAFGELLKRKLRAEGRDSADPLAYLRQRLLDPMGIEVGDWMRDAAGHPIMPAGAYLAPREWIKVGVLIANHGRWQGQVLIKPTHFRELLQGSAAKPSYGLTLWLNKGRRSGQSLSFDNGESVRLAREEGGTDSSSAIPDDLVAAAGAGKQRLYVMPSQRLVVLRMGHAKGGPWSDQTFLAMLLGRDTETGARTNNNQGQPVASSNGAWAGASTSAPIETRENRSDARRSVRSACKEDAKRLCAGAIGDWQALKQCYRDRRSEFSPSCRDAVADARSLIRSERRVKAL